MAPHALQNVELRKIRALQMLKMRVEGIPIKAIAKKLGISTDTVDRDLTWAIRNGFVHSIENDILTDLAAKAIKVYTKKLEEDNEYVAKHVLDIVVKLGDRFQDKTKHEQSLGLKGYVESMRMEKHDDGNSGKNGHTAIGSTGVEVTELPPTPAGLLGAHVSEGETIADGDDREVDVSFFERIAAEPQDGSDVQGNHIDGEQPTGDSQSEPTRDGDLT